MKWFLRKVKGEVLANNPARIGAKGFMCLSLLPQPQHRLMRGVQPVKKDLSYVKAQLESEFFS